MFLSLFQPSNSTYWGSKWGKNPFCLMGSITQRNGTLGSHLHESAVSPYRLLVVNCSLHLSKVWTPMYSTRITTSTCPTVTSAASSERSRWVYKQGEITGNRWKPFCGHVARVSSCINTFMCLLCWCSAGRLEVSSVASAGAWIRTACRWPRRLNRRADWAAEMDRSRGGWGVDTR